MEAAGEEMDEAEICGAVTTGLRRQGVATIGFRLLRFFDPVQVPDNGVGEGDGEERDQDQSPSEGFGSALSDEGREVDGDQPRDAWQFSLASPSLPSTSHFLSVHPSACIQNKAKIRIPPLKLTRA